MASRPRLDSWSERLTGSCSCLCAPLGPPLAAFPLPQGALEIMCTLEVGPRGSVFSRKQLLFSGLDLFALHQGVCSGAPQGALAFPVDIYPRVRERLCQISRPPFPFCRAVSGHGFSSSVVEKNESLAERCVGPLAHNSRRSERSRDRRPAAKH